MGEMGKIAKSSEKRKAGKDGSSESQSTEERPRGTEFRPDSPGELGQQQGYIGRIREGPKFSPQKRMHLNFGNGIPGVMFLSCYFKVEKF